MSEPAKVKLRGQQGEIVEYQLPADVLRYRDVPVIIEGTYQVSGPSYPGGYPWTRERMQRLVETYDPIGVYAATINMDHEFFWGGPALGIITAIRYREEDGLGMVYADLAICDPVLAWQVERGMWPARSLEWHDAEAIAAWAQEDVGDCLFYEEFDFYLTGFAFLGQWEPAIPRLGPLPEPVSNKPESDETIVLIPQIAARDANKRPRLTLTKPQEGPSMADPKATAKTSESPPEEGGEVKTAAATAEKPADPPVIDGAEPKEATAAATTDAVSRAELAAVQAENKRLEAMLIAKNREGEVETRLASFVRAGKLTAQPQREAFRRLASFLYGQPAPKLMKSSGEEVQLETAPLADLLQIVNEMPKALTTELVAHEAPGVSDYDKNPAAEQRSQAVKAAGKALGAKQRDNGDGGDE